MIPAFRFPAPICYLIGIFWFRKEEKHIFLSTQTDQLLLIRGTEFFYQTDRTAFPGLKTQVKISLSLNHMKIQLSTISAGQLILLPKLFGQIEYHNSSGCQK